MTASKVDILLVRACKAGDPVKRLRSTYRRFYYGKEEIFKRSMIQILVGLIERQNLTYSIRLGDLLNKLDPNSWVNQLNKSTFDDSALDALIGVMRYAAVDRFTGITWGIRHRRIRNVVGSIE